MSGSGVSSPLSVQFTRDNNGSVTQTRRYSDATGTNLVSTTDFGRDAVGNLTSEVHKGSGGTTVATYSNIFDALNRITRETRNGVAVNYAYDAVSQVTSDGTKNYSYDANGNRNSAGYSVGPDNHIASDGTSSYSYDAVGNTVRITKIADGSYWSLSYSLNNQVTAAKQYNVNGALLQEVDYVYDVFGNLISRTVTVSGISTVTKFAYDVSGASIGINTHVNPLWAELDNSGNITERYLNDDSGNKLARSGSGANGTAWLLLDHVGSVREVLDATGNLKSQISDDAFGNPTSETDSTWSGNYLFQGMFRDRARNVNRAVWREELADGQWGVKDQSGFGAGDTNLDRAIGNNALNGIDPSGLEDGPTRFKSIGMVMPVRSCIVCHNPIIMLGGSFEDLPEGYRLGAAMWLRSSSSAPQELDFRLGRMRASVEPVMSRVEGAGRVLAGVGGAISSVGLAETGIGTVAAIPLGAWSGDELGTGFSELWNGKYQKSFGGGFVNKAVGGGTAGAGAELAYDVLPVLAISAPNSVSKSNRLSSGSGAPNSGANSSLQAQNLARQLTSEEQLAEALAGQGTPLIGAGTKKTLLDAPRLAEQYGGNASDWAKMGGRSSATHGTQTPAGNNFEIHWYQNLKTGQIVEPKTKLLGH